MSIADLQRPRVLLVDDDAAVAKALAAFLSRAGYAVTIAGSAREAEGRLDERFDGLVLDLRMPEMRGDAFYYLACVRQPWLAARTLFVTGDITTQAETIVRRTNCPLLQKPFKREAFVGAMFALLPIPSRLSDRAG